MTHVDDTAVPDYGGLLRLDGRAAIVVGAGQGIGRQTAHALSQAGASLLCIDNVADLAEEVAAETGGRPWVCDARERADVSGAVEEAIRAFGRIDAVVDIVGMARYGDLVETSDEDYDWTMGIVLRHAWLFAQTAGQAMAAAGGGALVFVASVSGLTSAPRHAAYGVAKAGLMSLVRSAAVELGPKGVHANAVAPGVVWTPRVSGYLGDEGREANSRNTPLRRVALPADIAAAALFLVSDLSSYITGHTLVVDGGVGVKFPYPMGQ